MIAKPSLSSKLLIYVKNRWYFERNCLSAIFDCTGLTLEWQHPIIHLLNRTKELSRLYLLYNLLIPWSFITRTELWNIQLNSIPFPVYWYQYSMIVRGNSSLDVCNFFPKAVVCWSILPIECRQTKKGTLKKHLHRQHFNVF